MDIREYYSEQRVMEIISKTGFHMTSFLIRIMVLMELYSYFKCNYFEFLFREEGTFCSELIFKNS